MHSKWKIWDYFKSNNASVTPAMKGITAFKIFEPSVMKFIKEAISPEVFIDRPKVEVGPDVTRGALEDCFSGLSLFGTNDIYVVINAQAMSSDVEKYITSNIDVFSDSHLILFFDESNALFKNLAKNEKCNTVEFEAPAFWEYAKLLDFLSQRRGVTFAYDSKNYFIESVKPTVLDFDLALNNLQINLPSVKNFDKKHVLENLKSSKFDQFKLATTLSEKKLKLFYETLIQSHLSFDEYRLLFSFLQSHLIKLSDPSYSQKKSRPSKYDKEIMGLSKKWSLEQVKQKISLYSNWEILSKKRDSSLILEIKREFFKESYPLPSL